jgi:HSP20 family protein
MDQFFDDALATPSSSWSGSWDLALDVLEQDDRYVVKASLPGIDPEDLDITFENGVLTIKGEIREDHEVEEARYHVRERRYGAFSRSLTLPAGVDEEKIQANYEAGVLSLALPKSEAAKPKRIPVKTIGQVIIDR